MPEYELKALLKAVKDDASLQEGLRLAKDAHEAVAIAKVAGFLIFECELKQRGNASDAGLQNVAC
jgi:predicted ribosomally synthesized peptide with nif11-like leader